MSHTATRANAQRLTTLAIETVRSSGPIRLSDAFLRAWCGQPEPTAEVIRDLAAAGMSISPGADRHGGWEVSAAVDGWQSGLFEAGGKA